MLKSDHKKLHFSAPPYCPMPVLEELFLDLHLIEISLETKYVKHFNLEISPLLLVELNSMGFQGQPYRN